MNKISNASNISESARRRIFSCAVLMFLLPLFSQFAAAQETPPDDLVPPPLILIAKSEKSQLEAETDALKRTKTALELIENRVQKAEKFTGERKFTESLDELGGFQAIIINLSKFLERSQRNSKNLKSFKTLEISLRSFTPRLEIIRREMPPKYGYHVLTLLKFVRQARDSSTDKLFGNTVLPNNK